MDDSEELMQAVWRSRAGFHAFTATIDLLGMTQFMKKEPSEARSRLNDLHQGFGDAMSLYPGGEAYRVCFAGDSIFVVREIEPDVDYRTFWPVFCGHLFAITGFLHTM